MSIPFISFRLLHHRNIIVELIDVDSHCWFYYNSLYLMSVNVTYVARTQRGEVWLHLACAEKIQELSSDETTLG